MSNLKIDRSVTSNRYNSHMARVLRSKTIMSSSIKGKVWHILLKNLFSPIRRYSGKSHLNLCKKVLIVRMILSMRSAARYWLNVLLNPKKRTLRSSKDQIMVDLNQDLLHTLSQFN